MKKLFLNFTFCIIICLLFSACANNTTPEIPEGGRVYHDETIEILADAPFFLDDNCFIRLTITNMGEQPMLLCGSVGVRAVDAGQNDRRCKNLFETCQKAKTDVPDYVPIDGLLSPGNSVTGFICVGSPDEGTKFYHISVATDYINDEWVEFDYVFHKIEN